MASALTVTVGTRHGEHCTCKHLGEITATAETVIVNRDCPGQRELPHDEEPIGRVTLTWPARTNNAPLAVWGVRIDDADSDEQFTNVTGLRMVLGTGHGWDGAITVDLEQLTDADGKPLPTGANVVSGEDGKSVRSGVFRYLVAEMKVAEA